MSRGRSNSYDQFMSGSGFDDNNRPVGRFRPTIDPKFDRDGASAIRRPDFLSGGAPERLVGPKSEGGPKNLSPPPTDVETPIDDDSPKRPRVEGIPSDVNLNVTFKRAKPEVDHHLDEKKIKYVITKHIDQNRDLYFIKLVSGALKRKSFHSLMKIEHEEENETINVFKQDDFDVKIKYSYNEQLLHAWATILDKVKDMIDPSVKMTDRGWTDSKILYEKILKNDSVLLAFARYVAFIMMSESNNMVPRNRTRYMLNDQSRIEDERVLALMRALKNDIGVLDPRLAELYITP